MGKIKAATSTGRSGHLDASVILLGVEEEFSILPADGEYLVGGVPGRAGHLGRGVGGDTDVLHLLPVISVEADVASFLLRVGAHSQEGVAVVPASVHVDVTRGAASVDSAVEVERHLSSCSLLTRGIFCVWYLQPGLPGP